MKLRTWLADKLMAYLNKEKPPKRAYLCDFDRAIHELRLGDVILVEGRSRASKVIKNITHSPWTHSALFIGNIHNIEDKKTRHLIAEHYTGSKREPLIIESIIGQGTIVSSVTRYVDDHIRICRPNGLNHSDAMKLISFAAAHIGHSYDTRHFFDLGRFCLRSLFIPSKWKSKLYRYKPGQSTRDVCSTMIANAFTSIKFPIRPLIKKSDTHTLKMIRRNPWLCTPSDFDYSPYFDIIKYPILPENKDGIYRHFPWDESVISHDDEGIKEIDKE